MCFNNNFKISTMGGLDRRRENTQKPEKERNGGKLSPNAPNYLSKKAAATWRKIVPYLEDVSSVKRADSGLVEMYCTQYEIYLNAYDHIQENGEVQAIYKPVQDASGKILEHTFVGFKRNPMTNIYDSSLKNLIRISGELGLSPESRAELLKVAEPKKHKSAAESLKEILDG